MSTFRYRAINGEINMAARDFTCLTASISTGTYGTLSGTTLTAGTGTITTFNSTVSTTNVANITTAYITTANLTTAAIGILLAGTATITGSIGAGTATITGAISAGSAAITGSISAGSATIVNGLTAQKTSLTKDYPIVSYQPSLSTGQSTSLLLGVAGTPNNAAELTFNYTGGPGSPLNSLGLGLFGNENKLTLTPTSIGTTLPLTIPSVTFSPSIIPFKYSEGTWTPQFKYITSAGAANPLATITYSKQIGYYTRIGNQVTAYFNIVFTSLGADIYITLVKFFGVGNLPFVFDSSVTSLLVSDSVSSDLPNGFTGLVPTPLLPVFPASGRTVELVEKDTLVPLFEEQVIGIPQGTWTADGLTMMVRGPVEVNIPLFDTYAAEGQIYNHWVASAIVTYNFSFSGRVTYYTNAA